jgi:hypothetical protein
LTVAKTIVNVIVMERKDFAMKPVLVFPEIAQRDINLQNINTKYFMLIQEKDGDYVHCNQSKKAQFYSNTLEY